MRTSINLLQSVYLAKNTISEKCIYSFSGHPNPKFCKRLIKNFTISKSTTFQKNLDLIKKVIDDGCCLIELVKSLGNEIMENDISDDLKIKLIKRLGDIENKLSITNNEQIYVYELATLHRC